MTELARPCDRHVVCPAIDGLHFPDPDSPFANLSSEGPDPVPNPYCILHPSSPLCNKPPDPVPDGCRNCCPPNIDCRIIPIPDGPCNGRNCSSHNDVVIDSDGDGNPSMPFSNNPQTCTVECPDGSSLTHTIAAGRFTSTFSQAEADANAASYCEDEANSLLICIITDSLPSACVGDDYGFQVIAEGGVPKPTGNPYFWSASGLPPGMSINPTRGILFGTPTSGGTFNVTITVEDGLNNTRSKTLVLNVVEIISGPTLTSGVETRPYGPVTLTSNPTGGIWSVFSGSLPGGLSLNALGVISGIPDTGTGGQTFTFGVMYELGDSVCTKDMSIKIWNYDNTTIAAQLGANYLATYVDGPYPAGMYAIQYVPYPPCGNPPTIADNTPPTWYCTSEGVIITPGGSVRGVTVADPVSATAQANCKTNTQSGNPCLTFELPLGGFITVTWPVLSGLPGTVNWATLTGSGLCFDLVRIGQP